MSGFVCTLQIDRIQPSYPQRMLSAGKLGSFTIDAGHAQVLQVLRSKKNRFLRCLDLKETCWHLSRDECMVLHISFRGRKDLNGTLSQSFKELKDLGFLDLGDTKISGDLAVLANCTEMTHLLLQNTLVTGDLVSLAEVRIIQSLDLSNSKVTGNLGAFDGTELRWVRLSNTSITGDVAVLSTQPWIYELDLSHTEVTGTFHVNSVLKELEILKLTGTKTKIDFMGRHVGPGCPFPKMHTLEVSGLAMDASVSEFLAPLLDCRHLNSIGAAGCGLTGEVPKTALFFGHREFPFDWTPLGKKLGFLDLASNRIDKVDSIPRKLNSLVLAGNRNVSFAEGVLQKAVQDGILLDMQNVTFTNQTDAHRCMA